MNTRTGAGLLTTTGGEAGLLFGVSEGISIVEGRFTTVEGAAAVVAAGWTSWLEFIRYTPPNAAAPTTARPAMASRPLLAAADCAAGAATGIGCCIEA